MKGLTRQELINAFYEITNKYGKPIHGDVYCETQLISAVVFVLSAYDECNIIYEYGAFNVSPNLCLQSIHGDDYKFIGTVYKSEWFSAEQIKALHELAFGY